MIFIATMLGFRFLCFSQGSDIISVRKHNGQRIKSFTAGSRILLQTINGNYIEGPIRAIRNDSILITIFDIHVFNTPQGGRMIDTVTQWVTALHYKEIKAIQVFSRSRPLRSKAGKILKLAGAGYMALSLINGFYTNGDLFTEGNSKRLWIPLGALVTGIALDALFPVNRFTGSRHQIVYVKLN